MKDMKRQKRPKGTMSNAPLYNACRLADNIAEFERFKKELLPALQRDLWNGMTPQALRTKWAAQVTARQLHIALTDPDSKAALAAIRDLNDRTEGKPKETRDIRHRMQDMTDTEVDAVLKSELADLSEQDPAKLN